MSGEGQDIVRWADPAMYESAPMERDARGMIVPRVHLLWATPDPLGTIAAVGRMFKGIPTYNLSEITDEERRLYFEESFKSHLRAPHEFVQFHFFVEGVTRDWTHQAVRQRTASFAQESLRFAVKENLASETPMPPSIVDNENAEAFWKQTIKRIEWAYKALVNAGIPAEDARGLLPHATTTRLHWRTNFADLVHHAGNRLCTQAQFQWRKVFIELMRAIREYRPVEVEDPMHPGYTIGSSIYGWQFELLGTPLAQTFSPICYKTGKCEFEAIFDRDCSIRERVRALGREGKNVPSSQWDQGWVPEIFEQTDGQLGAAEIIPGIDPSEWMFDPTAARRG